MSENQILEDVRCCQEIPMSLPYIPVIITEKPNPYLRKSHYYDYAFECLVCGAVYEVIIERYSYTSIGDFMCPNYTSWSTGPALKYLESHPTLAQTLQNAKKEWLEQTSTLDKLIWSLKEKKNKKIDKVKKITGRLTDEQVQIAATKVAKIELGKIREYEKQKDNIYKTYLAKIREIVGLPVLDKKYRNERIKKHYQKIDLTRKLEEKQRQFSSIEELISKIESKDKLLADIHKIKMDIKDIEKEAKNKC